LTRQFAFDGSGLRVFVATFAYRHGIPREADLIVDMRFLENPHYVEGLRESTGCDPAVAAHHERDPDFGPFFDRLWRLVRPLLPRYRASGKSYLTMAIGCAGGRHRSDYVAGWLSAQLRGAGWHAELAHRDLPPSTAGVPLPSGAFVSAG
jgi:UPF0042 nucleotide-binding protein